MDTTIKAFEHAGLRVEIAYEYDSAPFDPRGDCNLGTMVCWHPDYMLGDEQIAGGAVDTIFETATGRTSFRSLEHVERYLRLARGAVCILPLYLLDHSGLSMSAGHNYVGRGDTASGGRDAWGNPRGWDTTMVGFIYTTAERIRELCGEPQVESDPFYCPRTWSADGRAGRNWPAERSAVEWIEQGLRSEVSVYDAYLRGEVYWYGVSTADGTPLDSCGGFLGGGLGEDGREIDALEYVEQEAREAAEACQAEREESRVKGWTALARGAAV